MLSSKLSFPEKNIADRVPMLFPGGEEQLQRFAFARQRVVLHHVMDGLQFYLALFHAPLARALVLERHVLRQTCCAVG